MKSWWHWWWSHWVSDYPCTGGAGTNFDKGELVGCITNINSCRCNVIDSVIEHYICIGLKSCEHELGAVVLDIIRSRGGITCRNIISAEWKLCVREPGVHVIDVTNDWAGLCFLDEVIFYATVGRPGIETINSIE